MSFMSKSQDQKEPVSSFLIRSAIREPFFDPLKAPFYFAGRKIKQWPGRFLFSNNPKSESEGALEEVCKTSRQGWNQKTMWGVFKNRRFLPLFYKVKRGRSSSLRTAAQYPALCFGDALLPLKNLRFLNPTSSPSGRRSKRAIQNLNVLHSKFVCKNSKAESKISRKPRRNKTETQRHSSALNLLRAKAPTNLKRPWFFKGTNSYLIPDFVEIQRKSFFQLLENGLIEEFAKRNPITNKNLEIFFYPEYYQLTPPEYNPRRAILLSKSYSSKLFIPAQLTDKKLKKSQLKWVLIGNLPLMTKRGHFVLNGAPRVIVNQILRSPGIYFQGSLKEIFSDQWSEKAEITYKRFYTDLICLRGTWLRIEIDKNKDVWAQMKKVPKIPLLWFLLAMGLTERIIFKSVINPTRLLANFNPEIKRKIEYEYVTNASDAWKEISNLISSSNKESYAAFSAGLLKGSSEATLEGKKQPPCIAKKGLLPPSYAKEASPLFYKVKSATFFSYAKNEGKPLFSYGLRLPEGEEEGFKKRSSFDFKLKEKPFLKPPLLGWLPPGNKKGRSERFPFAFYKGPPNQNRPLGLRKKEGKRAQKGAASSPKGLLSRSEVGSKTPQDHKNEPSQLSLVQSEKSNTALSLEPNIFKGAVLQKSKIFEREKQAASAPLGSFLLRYATAGKTPRGGLNKGTLSWGVTKRSSFLNIVEHSKEGRNWIFKRFMNPRAYDLGNQGRLNFNRKLGLSIDSNQTTLTAQDLLFATDYLFKVEKGLKNIDDIDHLKNRRVRTSGELLQIQIGIGLVRLEKIIREKLSKINAQTRASDFLTLTRGPSLLRKDFKKRSSFNLKSKEERFLRGGAVTQGLAGFADRKKQPLFALFTFGSVKTKAQREEHFLGGSYKATMGAALLLPSDTRREPVPEGEEAAPKVATRREQDPPSFLPTAAPLVSKKGGPGKIKRGGFAAPLGSGTRSAQTEEFKMNNLINTKAFNGALREFFGSSQLSQFMDQLNPLAEITHKRRLSSMGPGGVTRDSATLAIRGIHPTHYGRICPIETPEGKTVGLTNSLTTYARANPQGFLESPFYKVYKGQIQKSAGMYFLTAGQEENTKIAAADVGGGGAFGRMDFLPKNKIPAKIAYGDTISKISRDQVEYIGVSPIQMISIATSLIPFVEHDDANRALMGSNMQRQAVPLVRAERPLVGTGLESRTVSDSGHAVVARESGYVAYVSAKKMIIYAIPIHS